MKRPRLIVAAALVLAGGAYVLHGQSHGQAPPAVFQECQRLQAKIVQADDQIRDAEHQLQRVGKAIANDDFIRARNAVLIEQLEAWAEAK